MKWVVLLFVVTTPGLAAADGPIVGSLRMRGDSLRDGGETFSRGDVRVRANLEVDSSAAGVAARLGVEARDGSAPGGDHIELRYAYGEAMTPIGILSAGRMTAHWGLGMFENAGDCDDCDFGDIVHRAALSTPLARHWWTMAFDVWSTVGGSETEAESRTITLSVLRDRSQRARERRARAGKMTVEYGGFVSHRRHGAAAARATVADAWTRISHRRGHLEAEATWINGSTTRPMVAPGVLLSRPVRSTQFGAAVETELSIGARLSLGVDAGFASGDPAPGFGASTTATDSQAMPPFDDRVDNFRFHPSYRIDRLLYREIIGTVTDSVYARPHARYRLVEVGRGSLNLSVFTVASWVVHTSSTPTGARPLAIEIDPGLLYDSGRGVSAALEHAVLFPLSGLSGIATGTPQLVRVRLMVHL